MLQNVYFLPVWRGVLDSKSETIPIPVIPSSRFGEDLGTQLIHSDALGRSLNHVSWFPDRSKPIKTERKIPSNLCNIYGINRWIVSKISCDVRNKVRKKYIQTNTTRGHVKPVRPNLTFFVPNKWVLGWQSFAAAHPSPHLEGPREGLSGEIWNGFW